MGISTASQAHEQYEEDSDSSRTPKRETLAKIPEHSRPAYNAAGYDTDSLAPKRAASPVDTVQTGTVSPHAADTSAIRLSDNTSATRLSADTSTIRLSGNTSAARFSADTLAARFSDNTSAACFSADTLAANAFPADSLAADTLLSPHDRFVAAEEDMLLLIAHCEGVRTRAYWDPNGKKWTIGIGNTVRPDGSPVRKFDRIRSQEELMDYFKTHVEKIILPVMEQYLPLKDMNRGEIAAFGSLVYNCGPGVLRGRNKMPTELSAAFARYKKDGREEDKDTVKKLINAKIYAKGRALPQLRYRRDLETRILFGDIILDQAKADSLNNALNLSAVSIGGIYTIGHKNGGLPKDSTELVDRIANTPGQNLQDTLRQAFTPNVPKVIIRKKASRSGR